MALIKITGYIDTDGLDPDFVDLTDDTGLTSEGFSEVHHYLQEAGLDDIGLEVEDR